MVTTTTVNHTTDDEHKHAVQAIGYYDSMHCTREIGRDMRRTTRRNDYPPDAIRHAYKIRDNIPS
jgi:hypothetical protein